MAVKPAGNLFALWFNIICSAAITIGAVVFGLTTNPFGFFVAAIGVAIESVFVRALIKVTRERRAASTDLN